MLQIKAIFLQLSHHGSSYVECLHDDTAVECLHDGNETSSCLEVLSTSAKYMYQTVNKQKIHMFIG